MPSLDSLAGFIELPHYLKLESTAQSKLILTQFSSINPRQQPLLDVPEEKAPACLLDLNSFPVIKLLLLVAIDKIKTDMPALNQVEQNLINELEVEKC